MIKRLKKLICLLFGHKIQVRTHEDGKLEEHQEYCTRCGWQGEWW